MRIKNPKFSWKDHLTSLTSKKISPLAKFISLILKIEMENRFHVRRDLNEEILLYLEINAEFKKEIKRIRQKFKVPHLNPSEDIRLVSCSVDDAKSAEWEESDWLTGNSRPIQEDFENEVNNLLIKYNLPRNFYDWTECYILYGKPSFKPLYNPELIQQIMGNSDELQRIPPTTGEKKFLEWVVREKLGIKRRPPKKLSKAYKEFKTLLSKSKNKLRIFKTLPSCLQTLEQGKREKYHDEVVGEDIEEKITYKRLAADLYEDVDNDDLKKAGDRLRKQKQRLKGRMKLMLGK